MFTKKLKHDFIEVIFIIEVHRSMKFIDVLFTISSKWKQPTCSSTKKQVNIGNIIWQ